MSDMVHISFVDDNENREFNKKVPPTTEFRIPHRRASSLHVTNQSTTSEKIKVQSNIDEHSMDAIIELEPDEAIELDGRGYLDEPILESINILVSAGTTARVRVVIRA